MSPPRTVVAHRWARTTEPGGVRRCSMCGCRSTWPIAERSCVGVLANIAAGSHRKRTQKAREDRT